MTNATQTNTLTLMRGQVPVTSFLGSLGGTLRETRITAMIGYLISHYPEPWQNFFSMKKPISSVGIEADYERDRADVVIDSTAERVIVEAKVVWADPREQAKKYDGSRKFLFTNFIPPSEYSSPRVRYVDWDDVSQFLNTIAKSGAKPYVRHLSKELINYMKEHQLIRSRDSVEIYARELNDELTVNTFLKANIYGCWLERGGGTIARSLYFAPHFGKYIASEHPGIYTGISYLAKIEAVEVVDTWKSFLAAARKVRGGWWLNKHHDLLRQLRRGWGDWDEKNQRSFAFLATPRLVFNPPINKDLLQKGKGWLSRRTFSFDELFAAWGKSASARIR
jgi:hypothetical protein